MLATRSQRARAASNTGEQALLVLRKSGAMASPDDARSEAVCRAAALTDDTYGLVCAVTNHPEFFTFMEYANRGTLHWFALQLANAPGGPPGFLLD